MSRRLSVTHNYYYFASAAVAADSSRTTASSSTSWSRFSPPSNFVNGHVVDNVVHDLPLATITRRRLGETRFVQVSMTWALTCPDTVQQRPYTMRDIQTWLLDRGSVTIVWLSTEADDQASLHCVIVSADVMSNHTGRRDVKVMWR